MRYYLDTSIWLDLFEERDEPGNPKARIAEKLLSNCIEEGILVLYSDNTLVELSRLGYSNPDELFKPFERILLFVESTKGIINRSIEIARLRNVPRRDVLHAFLARDNRAILVSRDKHFELLKDITKKKSPEELI